MLSGHSDVAPARIPVSTLIVVIAVSVAIVLGGLMPASVTAALALAQ